MKDVIVGVSALIFLGVFIGIFIGLGQDLIKYLRSKKEPPKYTGEPIRIKPCINVAVIELIADYQSIIEDYSISNDKEYIELKINIKQFKPIDNERLKEISGL